MPNLLAYLIPENNTALVDEFLAQEKALPLLLGSNDPLANVKDGDRIALLFLSQSPEGRFFSIRHVFTRNGAVQKGRPVVLSKGGLVDRRSLPVKELTVPELQKIVGTQLPVSKLPPCSPPLDADSSLPTAGAITEERLISEIANTQQEIADTQRRSAELTRLEDAELTRLEKRLAKYLHKKDRAIIGDRIWDPRENRFVDREEFLMSVEFDLLQRVTLQRASGDSILFAKLQGDILEISISDLTKMDWSNFERICLQLLEQLGFSILETSRGPDQGIDLIAQDNSPLRPPAKYIISCKQWKQVIDVHAIRDLHSVVVREQATTGVLITTSYLSGPAKTWAKDTGIKYLESHDLRKLLRQYRLLNERGPAKHEE